MSDVEEVRAAGSRGPSKWLMVVGALGLGLWVALNPTAYALVIAVLLGGVGWALARANVVPADQGARPEPAGSKSALAREARVREKHGDTWSTEGQRAAWMSLLLSEVPAGLWITDETLTLVSTQGQGLERFGVGSCRLQGVPVTTFLRTRDPKNPALAAHHRALKGESVSFEQSWGQHVYQVTVGPHRNEQGEIEGVVGLCLAITERVRHDELLRTLVSGIATKTGKECLRSLVRHLGLRLGVRYVAVVELQQDLKEVRSLAAWSSQGTAPRLAQSAVGSICEGIEVGEWRHVEEGACNRFPEDQHLNQLSAEGVCAIGLAGSDGPGGALLIVDVVPLALHHLERASAGLFAERAAAELEREEIVQRLIVSERRFRMLAENLPGVIYLRRQDEPSSLLVLSESVQEVTGYPRSSFVNRGLTLMGLVHPEDQEKVKADMQSALSSGEPFHLRYRIRHASDGWRWIEEMGVGVMQDGREPYVEGYLWDVTGQVEAERGREVLLKEVLRGQKIESLGVLAGGIAHEFNNLLATILSGVGQLEAEAATGRPQDETLEGIQEAALRGGRLASQMLEYAGKGSYAFQRVELTTLVEGMKNLLRASVGQRAELRIELQRQLPEFLGDPVQLRHVIVALVLNAAEAIEATDRSDGWIVVRSFEAMGQAGDQEGRRRCCVEVSDNGCGLDAPTRERIFDPFFTTKFTGRGLGLAAASGIVRAHGGSISIESAPDQGSTLRVWLPVAEDSAPSPAPAAVVDESGEAVVELQPTVLVVDDEQVVRSLAQNVLVRAGYRVVTADNGRKAVELVRAQPDAYGLALVDVSMPGFDGMSTVDELYRLQPDLPVVLSSGYRSLDRKPEEAKIAAFLSKPYRPSELVDKVREVLSSAES